MTVRHWLLLAVLSGMQTTSFACMRFFEDTPAPTPTKFVDALQQHEGRSIWEERAKDRKQVADRMWDFRTQNNLSVALVHVGRVNEALDRMQTVERTYPNQVETAFNLGTAYELENDLSKAKFWIQEGIKRELKTREKNQLDGTEWLHLRILDAKMGLRRNPHYWRTIAVSGVDFGSARSPEMPTQLPTGNVGATLTLAEVQRSLQEQLHERLEFVAAPDPIVGDLLFDLANVLAVNGHDEDALDVYRLAIQFAPARAALAQTRFHYFAGTPNLPLIATMWSLALGTVGFYFARKKWLEREEWRAMPVQDLDALGPKKRTAFIDFSKFEDH